MMIRSRQLVGRDEEMRELVRAFGDARTGRGGAIFLVGEGGVGKTRLSSELVRHADSRQARVLRGRCSTIGPMLPFRPLAEALTALTRDHEPPDVAALGPYLPALGVLVRDWRRDDSDDVAATVVDIAEAVLRLLALISEGRGCVLVLDDLQHADAETLAIVEYLASNLHSTSTLLVGVVRSGPSEAWEVVRSIAAAGFGSLLRLDGFGREHVLQMTANVLDATRAGVPDGVVDHLRQLSSGIPLVVEELLHEMVRNGLLLSDRGRWTFGAGYEAHLPRSLVNSISARMDTMAPRHVDLLHTAAVLGHRSSLPVLQHAAGVDDRTMADFLRAAEDARILRQDEKSSDRYVFRHPLTGEAVLSCVVPARRAELATRLADAAAAMYPGLPGDWCAIVGTLRLAAGEQERAGMLFADGGRRALRNAAPDSAVVLLSKADELLRGCRDITARGGVMETLIYALGETGRFERAFELSASFTEIGTTDRAVALHTQLAWVAYLAGRFGQGLRHVAAARALYSPVSPAAQLAAIDAVHANLLLEVPGTDRLAVVESLAHNALTCTGDEPEPAIACQALQALGIAARERDLDEARRYFERAERVTHEHHLPIWRSHVLMRLGTHVALSAGDTSGLLLARQEAVRAGAITVTCMVDALVLLHGTVLRGDFASATSLIEENAAVATRFHLGDVLVYLHAIRAVLAAHQGRRGDMEDAVADFCRAGGETQPEMTLCLGLARAFCSLLEEDLPRARRDLARAISHQNRFPGSFPLNGRFGLAPLLDVLAGEEVAVATPANPAGSMRWNRQFLVLADAVRAGRAGDRGGAETLAREALRLAEPYGMARHLIMRLAAEAALTDGWGDPRTWLREAEAHFHHCAVPRIAGACRALLKRAGAALPQRRSGSNDLPRQVRDAGITVREHDVLQLLIQRLSNVEIGRRLHISHRTVEKHVGSLLAKTGNLDRIALCEYAERVVAR